MNDAMLRCIYFLVAHGWLLGRPRYCALGWRLAWQDCHDIVDVVMHNLFIKCSSHNLFDVLRWTCLRNREQHLLHHGK